MLLISSYQYHILIRKEGYGKLTVNNQIKGGGSIVICNTISINKLSL